MGSGGDVGGYGQLLGSLVGGSKGSGGNQVPSLALAPVPGFSPIADPNMVGQREPGPLEKRLMMLQMLADRDMRTAQAPTGG